MKRVFMLDELDCANCAAKMEDALRRIRGVDAASVNFFTQKLTLEAADDLFDEVLKQAEKTVKRIEPDCRIRGFKERA